MPHPTSSCTTSCRPSVMPHPPRLALRACCPSRDAIPHLVLHYVRAALHVMPSSCTTACCPSRGAIPHLVLHYAYRPCRDATSQLVLHYACRPSRDATSHTPSILVLDHRPPPLLYPLRVHTLKIQDLFLFSIKPPHANSSLTFDFYIAVLWKGFYSLCCHTPPRPALRAYRPSRDGTPHLDLYSLRVPPFL